MISETKKSSRVAKKGDQSSVGAWELEGRINDLSRLATVGMKLGLGVSGCGNIREGSWVVQVVGG